MNKNDFNGKTVIEPNKETLEAMEEVGYMKENPDYGPTYTSASEMLEDLLKDG